MMNKYKIIKSLFILQAKEFRRDYGIVFMNFLFPLTFVAALVISQLVSPAFFFEVAVVGAEEHPTGIKFVEALSESPGIVVKSLSKKKADEYLSQGKVNAIVVFSDSDSSNGPIKFELIVSEKFKEFTKLILDSVTVRMMEPNKKEFLDFDVSTPEDDKNSEHSFIFPGVLAMALLQLGLFATATPLLHAREKGSYRCFLLSPLTTFDLLLSQITLRFIIALCQISVLLIVGAIVIDFSLEDIINIIGVTCLGIIMLVSIGYCIAGAAPSLQSGMAIVMIVNFAFMFGGSVFFDPESSDILFYIAHIIPLSYLSDLYRQIITGNEGLWPIWLDLLVIILTALTAMFISVKTFRFDTEINIGG